MDLCEQCRTYSATHIDEEAALWCGRCAERRVEGAEGLPYLWEIGERRHFLTEVYPTLRYSSFIQDKRNPLWAQKLGIPFVPPGQRAVDKNDPPLVQNGDTLRTTWTVHVSEEGTVETWTLKAGDAGPSMQKQHPWDALESWCKAQRALATHERTKETLRKAQAAIAAHKRAEAARKDDLL